jgi:hypothetical protein
MVGSSLLAQNTSGNVTVTGSLSAASITESERLRFTLTVKNGTGAELNTVRILQAPDSYKLASICTYNRHDEIVCYDSGEQFFAGGGIALAKIRPESSSTAWGYLSPANNHRTSALTMTVDWLSPDGARSAVSVSLGNNAVVSAWDVWRNRISDLVKILGIPLALAVIGYLLSQLGKQQQEQAEREREARKEELEQTRSLRAETWKQMLPVSHEYAAKYYLPLSSASDRLALALSRPQPALAFFYLLNLMRIMAVTKRAIGGFYFKDIRGERLAAAAWFRSMSTLMGDADTQLSQALNACGVALDPDDNYGAFVQKAGMNPDTPASFRDPQVNHAWLLFSHALTDKSAMETAVRYLNAFSAVIDFESNRPFEFWYVAPSQVQITDGTAKTLQELAIWQGFSEAEMQYLSLFKII